MDSSETLTVPAQFESLTEIDEFVAHAAKVAGLDARAVYAVQLAVDEACSNIIEHAYGGAGQRPISCTCQITHDGLTVILHDHGEPFDPLSVPTPDLHAGLEQRNTGGLGMYFIRELMDVVRFESAPGIGNTLTLIKRRETTP